MSAKPKTVYICSNCAHDTPTWMGQCPSCGEWNTFVEDVVIPRSKTRSSGSFTARPKTTRLSDVISDPPQRVSARISEFDRVLGGGFVPGQVVLLAGSPGIGKSTLLTTISKTIKSNVLYVCGEESVDQIKLRVLRMGYKGENLLMIQETNVNALSQTIEDKKDEIGLVIVDSIQTIYSEDLSGVAGSISQVRGCTQILTNTAKDNNVPLVLVGHVTKSGTVAGPKVLEHIVDTVLYLEGDSQHMFRILRTSKNRFGPISEVGIFEMQEKGLVEVANPSETFLDQRMSSSGSAVSVVMEGLRPILFEVQALTVRTSFGYPKRTTSGFNVSRLQVLIAVLEKRANLNLSVQDVFLNIAGGFKVDENAVDLSVCLAIASSLLDKPIKDNTVVFGEVGLNGEVRRVSHQEKRIKEAKKLGFSNVISPANCRSVKEAMEKAFGSAGKAKRRYKKSSQNSKKVV
jgi:DNA repair protein RadA/Sms